MGPVEGEFYNRTGKRYLYNITDIGNIPSIMERGIICYNYASKLPHKSIAMDNVQQRRSRVQIQNGRFLHQYANLYFDYHNPMLYKRRLMAESLCILAVSAAVLDLPECVVSDRNAAASYASFYPAREGMKHLDFALIYDRDWRHEGEYDEFEANKHKKIKCAEVLIPFSISADYIEGACVLNDDSKTRMEEAGFDKEITVKAKVFYH